MKPNSEVALRAAVEESRKRRGELNAKSEALMAERNTLKNLASPNPSEAYRIDVIDDELRALEAELAKALRRDKALEFDLRQLEVRPLREAAEKKYDKVPASIADVEMAIRDAIPRIKALAAKGQLLMDDANVAHELAERRSGEVMVIQRCFYGSRVVAVLRALSAFEAESDLEFASRIQPQAGVQIGDQILHFQ